MDHGIIDEFHKKYENYFATYNEKQLEKEVAKLEKELEAEKAKSREYYSALYEIRCIIDINRIRISRIRKVLDRVKIKRYDPPKE